MIRGVGVGVGVGVEVAVGVEVGPGVSVGVGVEVGVCVGKGVGQSAVGEGTTVGSSWADRAWMMLLAMKPIAAIHAITRMITCHMGHLLWFMSMS